MHRCFDLVMVASCALVLGAAGTGCVAADRDEEQVGRVGQALGACGLGDEELAHETLTEASIPELSAVQRAQIVGAVQESAHTDVTTVEEAFDRVDENEIDVSVLRDSGENQFYVQVDFHAGDNPYGAIFYWGTAVKGGAIHDGFPEECGPLTFNYDQGDTAPECGGFLDYANTASFAALDAYLPSNVAQAIVDARAVAPFASVASVVAVNGVAEARLQQILAAARTAGLVTPSCSGIYDQIAVSATEATAIVDYVDQVSREELDGALSFLINHTVINTLLANRPFASVSAVSATSGVGPAVFRALRNAATFYRPFEELVAEVNEINHPDAQIRLDTHFDWFPLVTNPDQGLSSMTCFGIDPSLLPPGATIRPTLADGAEVVDHVSDAVASANFFGELDVDPAPGLADLAFRTAGSDFFGCYITSHPNPWVYDSQTFFVDTETGFGVLSTFHYVE
jgi:hypothetical protein